MGTTSTKCQPARGFGWLLLLGGLTACGYDVPWGTADAAGPAGRSGETPDIGDAPDPEAPQVTIEGALSERFTTTGYGSAWTLQAADLNGDGQDELLYGGRGIVAVGPNQEKLWAFELPAGNLEKIGTPHGGGDDEQRPRTSGDERKDGEERKDEAYGQISEEDAQRLRFLGVHVRAAKVDSDTVYVLDNLDRVHALDARSGERKYTTELDGDGNACDLSLFDGNGDGVKDFFATGGKVAYDGKNGEELFEVDVDFTPMHVANVGEQGKQLALVAGEPMDVCPAEAEVLLAMQAMKGEGLESDKRPMPDDHRIGRPEIDLERGFGDYDGATAPERDKDKDKDNAKGGYAIIGAEGEVVSTGGKNLRGVTDALVLDDGTLVLADDRGVHAYGKDGNEKWTVQGRGVKELVAADVDGDGNAEIVAHGIDQSASSICAITPDGQELFRAGLGAIAWEIGAANLDDDEGLELLTSLSGSLPQGEGMEEAPRSSPVTIAWNLTEQGPEELWRHETRLPARGYAFVEGEDGGQLYVGLADGTLRAHAPAGETLGETYLGSMNHAVAAGDLDGDGVAETITGDLFGTLSAISANGQRVAMMQLDTPAVVTGIAIGQGEDGGNIVIASGYAWNDPDKGIVQGFDADGNTLFTYTQRDGLGDLNLADLDGDGSDEIVAASFSFRFREERGRGANEPARAVQREEGRSGVLALDLDGNEVWTAPISDNSLGRIAVGDIDGDGAAEVAYGDLGAEGPFHVALIGGDGEVRFDTTSDQDDAVWLGIVDGGVAYGGRAGDEGGHVTLLGEDGNAQWSIDAGGAVESPPGMDDARFGAFAGTFFGTPIADVDGDGRMDLAYTTVDGELAVVSTESGEILEETRLGNAVGGPVIAVEGAGGEVLVASGYDFDALRSTVLAFSPTEGDALGELSIPGFVAGIAPASFGRNMVGFALAGTFDTYGVDLKLQREGRPLPEKGGED